LHFSWGKPKKEGEIGAPQKYSKVLSENYAIDAAA
jgi:hypothetical protein